ncbi:MAG: hypothetical protein OEX08_00550 [Candidatus Nomurabacteria bacterium]|nr:hypothetical protein [Candidatus Nomurabacteria bacterium]
MDYKTIGRTAIFFISLFGVIFIGIAVQAFVQWLTIDDAFNFEDYKLGAWIAQVVYAVLCFFIGVFTGASCIGLIDEPAK